MPALKLVEARDQTGNAALAGAGMAHEGHTFAGRNLQVEIPEQRFFVRVAECNVVECDLPLQVSHRLVIMLDDAVVRVNKREDALDGGQTLLELAPE